MKKKYISPDMKAVALRGPSMMSNGSYRVEDYTIGDEIIIGDTDKPSTTTGSTTNSFN